MSLCSCSCPSSRSSAEPEPIPDFFPEENIFFPHFPLPVAIGSHQCPKDTVFCFHYPCKLTFLFHRGDRTDGFGQSFGSNFFPLSFSYPSLWGNFHISTGFSPVFLVSSWWDSHRKKKKNCKNVQPSKGFTIYISHSQPLAIYYNFLAYSCYWLTWHLEASASGRQMFWSCFSK